VDIRADTYLWAVRMYKSRTLASEAIKGGKVKLNDATFKPSHFVKVGEIYALSIGRSKKIIEVSALTQKRASFEIARQFYIDRSPEPEKEEYQPAAFFKPTVKREKGTGRPTKKDRRDIDDFGNAD
jgi:ribosome-associated heat shock protein Hsp15